MEAKKRSDGYGIVEGVIWKQLLIFFFPILLGTFFQQLYNTADAMIVGKYVSKQALAAVGGATGNLINLIVGFFVGLASGATVIISQFYGARQDQSVSRTVHTAIALAATVGVLLTGLGLVLSPWMLGLLATPEDVMGPALIYIRIYFIGMVPSLIYNVGSGILRAVGDSKRPLYFLIVACLTNILLDVLFVVGFDLGVAGAAWATILSQTVSAVLVIVTLIRTHGACHLDVRRVRFHGDLLARIVRIGLPMGLQSVMYSISNVIIQASINSFGTDVSAAWSAWGRLDGFFWMVLNAFSISITTFVGQNFGAQKYDRVRKGVRECLAMAFAVSVAFSAVLLIFGRPFFGIFTNEAPVIDEGMRILGLIAPYFATYVCIEILSGAVRGAGESLIPTVLTMFGVCILRLVWLLVFVPMDRTIERTLFSYPMTWVVTSILFIAYYLKGGWMKRCQARLITRIEEKQAS
ncbi:MAG: MATE family efflux transporter [Clostridia bacterium]|nr:MATE family efflux transporter [Clostridia bacterium]